MTRTDRESMRGIVSSALVAAIVAHPGTHPVRRVVPMVQPAWPSTRSSEDPSLAPIFADHNVAGTFALLDLNERTCVRRNAARPRERFLPASTFKIFNTRVGLDERSIPDEETVLTRDGVDRGSAGWNRLRRHGG